VTAAAEPARVAVVGIHGHGASHVRRTQELEAAGLAILTAVADPRHAEEGTIDPSVREFDSLADLLDDVDVDVIVICTPIHTHFALTKLAFEAGVDVLLEKPPVTSSADFTELLEISRATGRRCQVGFQALASGALPLIRESLERGEIGEVTGVSANGCWVRTQSYWERAAWAGKRTLNGVDVVDGVLTNPLAHAVSTALQLAGASRGENIRSVELDQYRAWESNECDDTSVVRVRTTAGLPVTVALTLAAARTSEPSVTVHGTRGRIVFFYKLDLVQIFSDGLEAPITLHASEGFLLDNLLDVRAGRAESLVADLADNEGFTMVLDAIRRAPSPHLIAADAVDWLGEGGGAHPVVRGIENLIARAGREQLTFAELGAPWAVHRS
jgi:predicted dehydrogenase